MNLEDGRQLLALPVPLALAARAFCYSLVLLAPAVEDGQMALGEAFRLARRQAEECLRAIRFAHRSVLMISRRAAEWAACAFVGTDRLAFALVAHKAALAASCDDLTDRLPAIAARLADLAQRVAQAVVEADLAAIVRPTQRDLP